MKKLKLLLLVAVLALVPLRALAVATVGLCASGEAVAAHQHGAASDETSPADDTKGSSPTCSLCTACCTGASFAPDATRLVRVAGGDFEPIPFFGRDPGPPHPGKLERPPLSR